jgi:DNA-binding transcriptional regulator of glucitol operon
VLRRYSFLARPGWIALHLVTIGLVVTMVLLGRWQLHVSEHKHFNIQNFGYTIQWWLFSGFTLFFWWRLVRDHVRRVDAAGRDAAGTTGPETGPTTAEPRPAPIDTVQYRRYVMPRVQNESDDPVHTAYNEYLASLAAADAVQEAEETQ